MFDEESEDSFDSIDEVDEPVERGPYAKISDEKYELIVSAIEKGDSIANIARWLNVKRKTVTSIGR